MLKTMISVEGIRLGERAAYPRTLDIPKKWVKWQKHVENHGFLAVTRRKAVGFTFNFAELLTIVFAIGGNHLGLISAYQQVLEP